MSPSTPSPELTVPRQLPPEAYLRMSWVLRGGLLVAAALMLVGLVGFLAAHPGIELVGVLGTNPISGYLDPAALGQGLVGGHPQAYLTLGVLFLVVTPLGRVFTGFWYFLRGEEREMALVSGAVLGLLLLGLLLVGPLLR